MQSPKREVEERSRDPPEAAVDLGVGGSRPAVLEALEGGRQRREAFWISFFQRPNPGGEGDSCEALERQVGVRA